MTNIGPYDLNTIVTGDARELAQAIPDESVDLVLTDPPWGIGFEYANGYRDDPRAYMELLEWIVSTSNRIAKPGALVFVFQSMKRLRETWQAFPDESRVYIIAQNFAQLTGKVPLAFDPVIYWYTNKKPLVPGGLRDWYMANTAKTNGRANHETVWHEAQRPLDAIVHLVENYAPENGIVCDLFMGGGTTAVAAKITGRKYIGFEIDPATADLARARVANTQPPLFVPEHTQLELT